MNALKSYVEDLVERIRGKEAALESFTAEQRTGKSNLATNLKIEIEVMRDEARRLLGCLLDEAVSQYEVRGALAELLGIKLRRE